MRMTPQQYCLRWKHHHSNVQNMFAQLLEKERFCDVTLYCSGNFASQVPDREPVRAEKIRGVSLRAHRVVLAACSELLGALLGAHEAHGEPVVVIDGAEPRHLRALLDYMYTGEMNVHHSQLASLLKTAEELRIKGLTDIRWNNKDEPPDSHTDAITATSAAPHAEPEHVRPDRDRPDRPDRPDRLERPEPADDKHDKCNVNGGPPPLIKLPVKDKASSVKREHSDSDSSSPKRQRLTSFPDLSDDEATGHTKLEKEEWQHGNMNITAERVVGWASRLGAESGDRSADASDDEWADAPADIGSFLHTNLRVDGDNSNDEESNERAPPSTSSSAGTAQGLELRVEPLTAKGNASKPSTMTSKLYPGAGGGGVGDPRFADVVKLNDYLRQGRRPQFWEEHYVRRVMEAVRLKELEMKQAAEILGVSYGTLYGRYRDVYGCINRPYRSPHLNFASPVVGDMNRSSREQMWVGKSPSDLAEALRGGDVSLEGAAAALGVSVPSLAAHLADITNNKISKDFDPVIDLDPLYKVKSLAIAATGGLRPKGPPTATKTAFTDKESPEQEAAYKGKSIAVSTATQFGKKPPSKATSPSNDKIQATKPAKCVSQLNEEEPTVAEGGKPCVTTAGKWPSIRVASLESLRSDQPPPPTSPTQLMRTRPDLTIVAAKKPDQVKPERDQPRPERDPPRPERDPLRTERYQTEESGNELELDSDEADT